MSELAISTANLTKRYGEKTVLDNVNLHVPDGAIYGFVGSNGAGKTTMLRILLGLVSATSGSATVLGYKRGRLPCAPMTNVAYLPDVPSLDPWVKGKDALITFARLSGIEKDTASQRADSLLELVGLSGVRCSVGSYSRGMRQRLGIASALVGSPRLLVMDEPTSALDPIGRSDVLSIISSLKGKATVIFSSHLLHDVQQICTHVGILNQGRLLAEGEIDTIFEHFTQEYRALRIEGSSNQIESARQTISSQIPDLAITSEPPSLQEIFEYVAAGGKL